MSHTITAIFETDAVAQSVRSDIAAIGVPERHISVVGGTDRSDDIDGLHLPDDEASTYRQAVRQGHYVVSAEVEDAQIDSVANVMRHPEHGVDIDAYETDYRAGPDYAETATVAGASADVDGEQSIQLAEERLTVGKRMTEKGSAHIRTYVQEIPVEERVRLREERLSVERRPVDRVVSGTDADALFQDREIEVTTRSEEAVVGKQTVVTEEVVHETVRKTDVEIDEDGTDTTGRKPV